MKLGKHLGWITFLAGAVVMLFAAQGAMAAIGSIVGSKHDFSTSGPSITYKSATETQVCVYCHAPHNTGGVTPLWNHTSTASTFTLYSSSTLNATLNQPAGVSKLCLSCHDGTVAIDSFGGATGAKTVTGSPLLGADLANDHPIGFTYDAALVTLDPGLKAITTAATIGSGNTGTIETKLLVGGKVECASCHDVHNSSNNTAVEAKLLRITSAGSALCIACHDK